MRKWFSLTVLLLPVLLEGSGMQNFTQSANSLAYSGADKAALADDASTVFYNPAGMTRFCHPEAILGIAFTDFRTTFDGSIRYLDAYSPTGATVDQSIVNEVTSYFYSQNLGAAFGEAAFWTYRADLSTIPPMGAIPIPNATFKVPRAKGDSQPMAPYFHALVPLFYSRDFGISAGISVAAPFLYETNFSGTYVQDYAADTQFQQYAINPALAIRWRGISLGAGIDYQYFKTFSTSRIIDTGSSLNAYTVDPTLRHLHFSWKSRIWNWNVGALVELTHQFRIGATYRARSDYRSHGSFNFFQAQGKAHALYHLPDYFNVGFYYDLLPCLGLLFDFEMAYWSRFHNVLIHTTVDPVPINFDSITLPANPILIPFHFKNSYQAACGAKYTLSDDLIFKCGLSYTSSPTRGKRRNLQIPDTSHYGISSGLRYAINCHLSLDFAYRFLFFPKQAIQHNPLMTTDIDAVSTTDEPVILPHGAAEFNGSIKNQAQLFSMQLCWKF